MSNYQIQRIVVIVIAAATPEEDVSAANLGELAFVGEAGLAEGSNVDSVAREFSCY